MCYLQGNAKTIYCEALSRTKLDNPVYNPVDVP